MSTNLSKEQKVQEDSYSFPYHFLPHYSKGVFKQVRVLEWGYEYQSYIDFLLSILQKKAFSSLLDVGCGEGRFIYELQQKFPTKRLIGTDFSENALNFAKSFNPNGKFILGDITDSNLFPDKFDVITLIETLEHIKPEEISKFVSCVALRLNKGGLFIITVPSTTRIVNAKHYQHFTLEKLQEVVGSHFSIEEYYFLNRVGFVNYFVKRILANRFFILNEKNLLKFIYSFYIKYLLFGKPSQTQRICIVCKLK